MRRFALALELRTDAAGAFPNLGQFVAQIGFVDHLLDVAQPVGPVLVVAPGERTTGVGVRRGVRLIEEIAAAPLLSATRAALGVRRLNPLVSHAARRLPGLLILAGRPLRVGGVGLGRISGFTLLPGLLVPRILWVALTTAVLGLRVLILLLVLLSLRVLPALALRVLRLLRLLAWLLALLPLSILRLLRVGVLWLLVLGVLRLLTLPLLALLPLLVLWPLAWLSLVVLSLLALSILVLLGFGILLLVLGVLGLLPLTLLPLLALLILLALLPPVGLRLLALAIALAIGLRRLVRLVALLVHRHLWFIALLPRLGLLPRLIGGWLTIPGLAGGAGVGLLRLPAGA